VKTSASWQETGGIFKSTEEGNTTTKGKRGGGGIVLSSIKTTNRRGGSKAHALGNPKQNQGNRDAYSFWGTPGRRPKGRGPVASTL